MSWAGLAGNQWISRTNVSDAIANSILGEVHSPGTSDKWCTWDEMHYFCNLPGAPTGARWATKTDVLSYLPPATPAPYLIPVYFTHGVWNSTGAGHSGLGPSGWPTGAGACSLAGYVDYFRTYCSTSTIGVNSKLYSTSAGGYNPTIAQTGFDSSNPYFYAQSSYITLSIAGDGSWNVDSIDACLTDVGVHIYANSTSDFIGRASVTATSDIAVDTDIDVYFTIYGDLGSVWSNYITIFSGNSSSTNCYDFNPTSYSGIPGENLSGTLDTITPSASSTQNYQIDGTVHTTGC